MLFAKCHVSLPSNVTHRCYQTWRFFQEQITWTASGWMFKRAFSKNNANALYHTSSKEFLTAVINAVRHVEKKVKDSCQTFVCRGNESGWSKPGRNRRWVMSAMKRAVPCKGWVPSTAMNLFLWKLKTIWSPTCRPRLYSDLRGTEQDAASIAFHHMNRLKFRDLTRSRGTCTKHRCQCEEFDTSHLRRRHDFFRDGPNHRTCWKNLNQRKKTCTASRIMFSTPCSAVVCGSMCGRWDSPKCFHSMEKVVAMAIGRHFTRFL